MSRRLVFALAVAAFACQREPVAPAVIVPVPMPALAPTPAQPASSAEAPRVRPPPTTFGVGDLVDVEWRGQWYAATVLAVPDAGRYTIHYDGYGAEWDETVGSSRIRPRGAEAVDPGP
ncbi:MAG: hypothetical protein JNL38_13020 [Myxococcales bacterium]|nr:hypothetical protein [Myxococcales bacterium]